MNDYLCSHTNIHTDQSGRGGRHISHTVPPPPTPHQAPTDMQITIGVSQFAPLSVLTDIRFVCGDALFLSIEANNWSFHLYPLQ